jgi:hypothetical protein
MAQQQRKRQLTLLALSQHTRSCEQEAETTLIIAIIAMETEVRRASMIKRILWFVEVKTLLSEVTDQSGPFYKFLALRLNRTFLRPQGLGDKGDQWSIRSLKVK